MSTNIFDKKFDNKPDPTFQGQVKFTFGVSAKVSPYKESKPITAAGELKIWCDDVRDLSLAWQEAAATAIEHVINLGEKGELAICADEIDSILISLSELEVEVEEEKVVPKQKEEQIPLVPFLLTLLTVPWLAVGVIIAIQRAIRSFRSLWTT
ncbi:MAG: hypothetical protein FJ009_06205 [Chloroflexi bacterium]|nr:hypothetical protein [Chloroflexota bacterium]